MGRRVRWVLTPPGRRLLTEGARHIYGFGNVERSWDGKWLVVLASVPEAKRDLRLHQADLGRIRLARGRCLDHSLLNGSLDADRREHAVATGPGLTLTSRIPSFEAEAGVPRPVVGGLRAVPQAPVVREAGGLAVLSAQHSGRTHQTFDISWQIRNKRVEL